MGLAWPSLKVDSAGSTNRTHPDRTLPALPASPIATETVRVLSNR